MIGYCLQLHRRYLRVWVCLELTALIVWLMMAGGVFQVESRSVWRETGTTFSNAGGDAPASRLGLSVPIEPVVYQGEGPFGRRQRIGEFPAGVDWLNTKNSLQLSDLKGKLVLLDFWTYCCINCMHILPTLKKAEEEFEKELVVVGVHTAKFETEKDTENIRAAILRYEIKHPVLNDAEHKLWRQIGVSSWPTLVLIDPEGYAIWANAGEIPYQELQSVLKKAVAFYKRKGMLEQRKVFFDLVELTAEPTPLRFPGKITTDTAGERLFISDSNHNRIVVAKADGTLLSVIGTGRVGAADGSFEAASFNHPQGMAYRDEILWVADTENHLIRRIDLRAKSVSTVAGTGKQTETAWPGLDFGATVPKKLTRIPKNTPIGSPWDLWIHQDDLYIAMAGPHQIWKMDLEGKGIAQFAGSGREDIVDGKLLPRRTYEEGSSAFAQPSGLTSDGEWLYVADSEGSSIRAVPLSGQGEVRTVVGTSKLRINRLFTFGDVDGVKDQALLQHPLGVSYRDGKIYVADTYNNKIKAVDAKTGSVITLVGTSDVESQQSASQQPAFQQLGSVRPPLLLDEPGGLCVSGDRLYIADTNQHVIRVLNLHTNELSPLVIEGLTPPQREVSAEELTLPQDAKRLKVSARKLRRGLTKVKAKVVFEMQEGWKLNTLADFPVTVIQPGFANMNLRTSVKAEGNAVEFEIPLPEVERQALQIAVSYYYCQADDQGLCLADSVVFEVPVEFEKSEVFGKPDVIEKPGEGGSGAEDEILNLTVEIASESVRD